MNTFVSTTTGFSPYELVFLKKPPDILNLYFEPLETIAKGYRDYCLKMRAKLDNISSFITELKTFQQQRQALERNTQATKPEIFKRVNWFIFLLHQQFHYKPIQRNAMQILSVLWLLIEY